MNEIKWLSPASAKQMDDFLKGRSKKASKRSFGPRPRKLEAGERVRFAGGLESVFSYPNPPAPGESGSVVLVRTASGDTTCVGPGVFIKWDSRDVAELMDPRHLLAGSATDKTANTVSMRLAGVGDLADFVRHGDDLVHKATKDLWALRKDGDDFVIERLFEEEGGPLKV